MLLLIVLSEERYKQRIIRPEYIGLLLGILYSHNIKEYPGVYFL